ncbi:MAG: acyl-CoA/acyl-ACP dehydrogenase [Gammaproteobacteria bacterium]|nr:acyl-CoA/acyl-ACP dehydrogenase [Gammaproteobacteria bacterium]MCP5201458.1 acyl-CoA/acyl-ACP dehydrogenase [Gammaproteobacteria bacterium]
MDDRYERTEAEHLREIRRQLRRFVAEKMPREKRVAWDRGHTWDRDLFSEIAAMGYIGLTVPESYGGVGIDIPAAVAVIEELAQGGPSLVGPYIHAAFYAGMNLVENGSQEQRADLLPLVVRGDLFLSYGLSEPDVGGDLAAVQTTARLDGETITLNGTKRWCTGADWADYIYCLVRSGAPDERHRNLSFVLVPTDGEGVRMAPLDHINLRYTASMDVYFDDVRLPRSAIVGGPPMWNKGWQQLAGRALDVEKIEVSAMAYGFARAALAEAWAYAQSRTQFGCAIAKHQAVRHKLVEARTRLSACRHMLYHAAELANRGLDCAVETSMAKLFVSDVGLEIALASQQVMGAYGLCGEYDIERNVRELLGMPIVGGSSDMQRNNLGRLLRL